MKNLSADKDMAQLAASIVEKCKYIHPSRTEEVEQVLLEMCIAYALAVTVCIGATAPFKDRSLFISIILIACFPFTLYFR